MVIYWRLLPKLFNIEILVMGRYRLTKKSMFRRLLRECKEERKFRKKSI